MRESFKVIYIFFLWFLSGLAVGAEALIDTNWVRENLQSPNVVFLDVGSNMQVFKKAHIPGAIFTHYQKDRWRVAGKKRGKQVPGLLPSAKHLEKLLSRLGIENKSHVIIVPMGRSAGDMAVATRIYWTFKVVGHDKVSILNGGMRAYIAAKLPIVDRMNVRAPTNFVVQSNYTYLATETDILEGIANKVNILDSRVKSQYLGFNKSGRAHRAGTIPTSENAPGEWMTVNGGGQFRSKQAIIKLYTTLGLAAEEPAIVFCNTGHWASLGWFVHSEILGNKESRLYDGSMAEYTTSKDLKIDRKINLGI